MDAEIIKTIVITIGSVITTLGLAYIAARWHVAIINPTTTNTTNTTTTTNTVNSPQKPAETGKTGSA